jgi:hypothetical protein
MALAFARAFAFGVSFTVTFTIAESRVHDVTFRRRHLRLGEQ